MPYSESHKEKVREQIVESARRLFNVNGLKGVSIDEIMSKAGLTRGGFYNHFSNKEELFAEAVDSFLMGRGAQWREDAGVHSANPGKARASAMLDGYLATKHLGDLEGQCPMIALPTDVARAGVKVKSSYEKLLRAMIGLFESNVVGDENRDEKDRRQKALVLSTLCVGGMVLSKAINDQALADEIREAALNYSNSLLAEN